MSPIFYTTTKTGQRHAYLDSRTAMRPIRISLDKAALMLATGQASLGAKPSHWA